jgi:hypothetical protein
MGTLISWRNYYWWCFINMVTLIRRWLCRIWWRIILEWTNSSTNNTTTTILLWRVWYWRIFESLVQKTTTPHITCWPIMDLLRTCWPIMDLFRTCWTRMDLLTTTPHITCRRRRIYWTTTPHITCWSIMDLLKASLEWRRMIEPGTHRNTFIKSIYFNYL